MSAQSEFTLGLGDGRSSSRVLKPPGGGHSNIFSAPDAEVPRPRPKYNQQNSSNLNYCMNTVDPNEAVAKIVTDKSPARETPPAPVISKPVVQASAPPANNHNGMSNGGSHAAAPVVQNGGAAKPPPTPMAADKPSTPVKEKPVNLVAAPAPAAANAAPSSPTQSGGRVRQPPGGFSSGLW